MTVTITHVQKKKVFVASEVPAECVRRAQVAIRTGISWHLIGPNNCRAHGFSRYVPMPEVRCPVVDTRQILDEVAAKAVLARCTDRKRGVFALDELLDGLEALGAIVQDPQRVAIKVQ
jgi:hypothetical protein